MAMSVEKLEAPLGAIVSGIDISRPLASDEIKGLEDVWRERLVVVLRGQRLSDPQLIAFSRQFGELDPPGANPYGEPFLKEHPERYLDDFHARAGKEWHHSAWDFRNPISASADKVHLDVQFTRYRADGSVLGRYRSIWVVSCLAQRWAAQLRSSFAA